jgi:hypothetical protein
MKFDLAVVYLLGVVGSVHAFAPPQPIFSHASASISLSSALFPSSPASSRTFIRMVAGGAERAYGDDYYDGTQFYFLSMPVPRLTLARID